ncbi:hypothetical protein GOV14_02460 [Candidatus Pacearchaeota archaeon]|nr:hypothetical protein [Candidatus Pacearchaeota archaeon]
MKKNKKVKEKVKVLCVCAKGINRSQYLAGYLKTKGYETRFGGVEGFNIGEEAPNPITQQDLDWADVVIIVRERLLKIVARRFDLGDKQLVVLDVTDSIDLAVREMPELKDVTPLEFDKFWRKPRLREAIKPFLPLTKNNGK